MNVIGPSCALPSETSPGCACATASSEKTGSKAAGVATMTALVAAACTACCILPFTLPAAVLAFAGGSIAVLDHAHGWMTKLAIAVVIGAWCWIGWRRWRSGRRIARTTAALMIVATLLTVAAACWPLIEPIAFHALGIAKNKASRANEQM
jgi:cytochrome bd-type quinol oxidase subunit 2